MEWGCDVSDKKSPNKKSLQCNGKKKRPVRATLLYYSNDQLPEQLRNQCLANIVAIEGYEELIAVVPPDRGRDIADVIGRTMEASGISRDARIIEPPEGKRGHHDITLKTLAGLEACKTDMVYLMEHDVLYPHDYLSTLGGNNEGAFVWFNINAITANKEGYLLNSGRTLTSNAFARVEVLWEIYTRRRDLIETGGRIKWGEPGRNDGDGPFTPENVTAPTSTIDIRWGGNLTGGRDGATKQTHPYWGNHADLWTALNLHEDSL